MKTIFNYVDKGQSPGSRNFKKLKKWTWVEAEAVNEDIRSNIYTLEIGTDYDSSTDPRYTRTHTHTKSSNWVPCIRTGATKGLLHNQRGIYPRKTLPRPVRLENGHWSEMLVLDMSRGVTLEKPETQAYAESVWGPKSII